MLPRRPGSVASHREGFDPERELIEIFVDGDGCPVKDEIYVVATRYGVPVALVANTRIHVPEDFGVKMVVVDHGPGADDD